MTKETSAATGIDTEYLDDPRWKEASVAERMSWASNRKTSRLEDMAYCLMGLFDVNMPLLYGEGQKAFMRLQHETVKTVDDEPIFAWKDGTLLESGMFVSSPAAFIDGGDIMSIEFPGLYRPDAYERTNRGLSIEIVIGIRGLVSMSDHLGTLELMPLHCRRKSDQYFLLAVELKRMSSKFYMRALPWDLQTID